MDRSEELRFLESWQKVHSNRQEGDSQDASQTLHRAKDRMALVLLTSSTWRTCAPRQRSTNTDTNWEGEKCVNFLKAKELEMCVFITAVPIVKLFAWGQGDSTPG
jgi:hypothetical protein